FYRPSGLQGEPAEAPAKITWKLNNAQLQANNPTPYYVSFNEVKLESGGKTYNVNSSMVTPFSQASFGVTSLPGSVSSGKVVFKAINDFGGNIDGSATF
ncbi:fimbrial chaperone, partial [Escherichia coli]|nr:fimbrial chaperone [Escherichia coli]EJJ5714731.1 fimbrial chaperone [Escherichia coli]EJV6831827.1 fimbrial chaperone [Escherichia coli]ELA4522746.1 fimbrial chaperone [Escherichia coli]ELC5221615.1 fimbrial chaperone [Escherichia coli]